MGDPIKAERTAKHFAAVVSPELAATPFGSRMVPSVPAVSFAIAELVAERTYGNSANLFLERSVAIDSGKFFKPVEFLPDNPVEGGFSTSHGHMGVISGPAISPCPGAINCGVLPGPNVECSAEFEGLIEALAERMANEFLASPFKFLTGYNSAHDQAIRDLVEEKGKGYWESIKGAGSAIADGASSAWNYVTSNDLSTMASDAGAGISSAYEGAVAMTTDVIEAIAELSDLTFEDIKAILKDWLRELLGDMACAARDILAGMLADPKPMAEQLGEAVGAAKVHAAETVAVVAVTRGAGGAASKLGQVLGKAGGRIGGLYERMKTGAARRRQGNAPDKNESPDKKDSPPIAGKTDKAEGNKTSDGGDDGNNKDGVPGNADGKPDGPCLCEIGRKADPVYALTGAKVLDGRNDLDFVLEAPLPLVWQRTYVSSNASVGWLGQGWSLPIAFRLEPQEDRIDFIDTLGRRTRFPTLAVGERFFSKYEHTTLQRNQRNQYELIGPDGLRLIFGLGPLDQARLSEVEKQEAQRELRETEAWRQLLASRAARGEEPLPERSPDARGNLPPQAQILYLLGMIDPNHNHLRLHYSDDGLPRHLDTSSGRRVGFIFDRTRVEPRLTHVVELLGGPDERGHYPREQQEWLVEYRYSIEGDLIEVRDGDGQLGRTFAWRNHMMVEHTEPGGLVARYQWDQLDPKGRVLRSSSEQGQFWIFDYDEVAGCTRVTDASGREERFLYDKDKNLIGLVDAAGGETRYERDVYGNLIALIDPGGRVTRQQYDARGNLLSVTQPDGARYQLRWHESRRKPVAVSDPLGRTTHYRYDERGNLIAVTEPNGAVTEYRLDGRGLPTTIIDARGGHKHLERDAQGRLLAYTDCSGNRTQYSYDAQGRLASVTDALGHNTQYGYARINRRDRLNSIRHADGAIERFAHDPLGRLIAHHDPLGRVTRYQLDTRGRPLQRIDALGHSLRYEYDVHGRLIRLHNENNAVYRFAWDALDRLVAEQGFDGRRIDYRYDATGQLLESVDGVPAGSAHLGRSSGSLLRTRYQRDAMGRLLDKFSYKPGTDGKPQLAHSRYHYDAAGQLVCARNRQARVELFYNQAGQLAREVLYSRGGQRSELSHAYDLLGNRETTTLPDGRLLNTLTYGSGHVHQINLDFEVICDFERDALHRETGRTQGALYTHFELDPLGRLLRSQASLQRQAANPQVGPGLDTGEPSQGQRIARRYQYDLAGHLLGIDDRRNGSTRYSYDALGRLLSAQAPQASEVFAFDPAHNLMQPEEAQRQEARLKQTTWSEEEWSAYVQANLDNPDFNPLLTPAEAQADPSTWGENKPNRLRVWEEHRYAYDAWGNCIEKKSGPHTERQFQWDAEHQLTRVSVTRRQGRFTHTEHWGYDYDPFGRRIAKYRLDPHNEKRSRPWLDDETTHYGWDGNRLLLERQGYRQQLYIYEPGSFVPLAMVRSEGTQTEIQGLPSEYQVLKEQYPEQWGATLDNLPRKIAAAIRQLEQPVKSSKSSVEVLYYHTDHLGTPRELTDTSGHILWSATYKAWGNTAKIERPRRPATETQGNVQIQLWKEQENPVEQNLRFQGQYYDQETGLHYNRFRYYDPDCGRFVSQDPIGLLGGINNYQYASNPVGWIDALGLARVKGITPNNEGTRTTIEGGRLEQSRVGYSTKAGGSGITNDVVRELYESLSEEERSRFHGYCGEAEALSKIADEYNVKTVEELRQILSGATSTTIRNDGKPLGFCNSCSVVMGILNVCDGARK